MIGDATAARLRTIRAAGINRVKRAAIRAGIATVEQDMKLLRDTAHGSTYQATEKSGLNESTVRKRLKRYAEIAQGILDRDARRMETAPGFETGVERSNING